MWYIHVVDYYLGIRRNEDLIHAVTWMNLEDISCMKEVSYKRSHILWLPLNEVSRIGESIKTENTLVVA